VAVGGPGVSSQPHLYVNDFDHLFIGEAELTWPTFLADWEKKETQKMYRQVGQVDLTLTAVPRWNSIADQLHHYRLGAVQTSRGCPFDCEFCDVSLLFGDRYRSKPIDRVLEEVHNLQKLGASVIVFCDDNFIGNPRYAKELLKELIPLNNSFQQPLGFGSEMSMNMAKDDELLELLADANFREIFIGIESVNKESLKETHKLQNVQSDLVEDIKKIQSYALPIRGSLIVGFDHDDMGIFEDTFRFTQESFLAVPSIRILMAPPGTRLWKRLQKEGRLLDTRTEGRFFGNPATTNIIPKNMTRTELQTGFLKLREKVYDWENFAARVKGLIANLKRQPNVPNLRSNWKFAFQFACFFFSSLVDNKTRVVMLKILLYTRKHARFLLPRVTQGLLRQFGYAYTTTHKIREVVQRQIDLEKSGELKLEIDTHELPIPESLKGAYEQIFPEIHKEVFQRLNNKALTEDTLITIFAGFFAGVKAVDDSFSEQDRNALVNFARQAVDEKNHVAGSQIPVLDNDSIPNLKKAGLSDAIFKAVQQELLISESSQQG
jgi:radical SAM superfamily enzyme YgiQ (UPF0313 family)